MLRDREERTLGIAEFVSLGRRLEEIDERTEWCNKILADLSGPETAGYITLAMEHYGFVKELLLNTPSLSYDAIRGEVIVYHSEVRTPPGQTFLTAIFSACLSTT